MRKSSLVALIGLSMLAACSGRVGSDGSGAPASTPSGIAVAPPRAFGPGSARMNRPAATGNLKDPDDEDEPMFPVPGMPEGGLGGPPAPTEL